MDLVLMSKDNTKRYLAVLFQCHPLLHIVAPTRKFDITIDLKSHCMNLDILPRQIRLLHIKTIN
jgi:hypothetical protein